MLLNDASSDDGSSKRPGEKRTQKICKSNKITSPITQILINQSKSRDSMRECYRVISPISECTAYLFIFICSKHRMLPDTTKIDDWDVKHRLKNKQNIQYLWYTSRKHIRDSDHIFFAINSIRPLVKPERTFLKY